MVQPEPDGFQKKPQVWGGWATIGFSLAIFAIYIVVTVLVAVGFLVNEFVRNPGITSPGLAENLVNSGLLLSLATIFSAIAGIGFVIFFISLRRGFSFTEYLGMKRIGWRTLLILLGLIIFLFFISAGVDRFFPAPQDTAFTTQAYQSSVVPVLFWIAVVVFAPLFEECFFRGFLFVGLWNSSVGTVGAVLITSAAWAALHLQYSAYGMVTIFILGVILGIIRIRTRSIWSTLFIHAGWNLATLIATAITLKTV